MSRLEQRVDTLLAEAEALVRLLKEREFGVGSWFMAIKSRISRINATINGEDEVMSFEEAVKILDKEPAGGVHMYRDTESTGLKFVKNATGYIVPSPEGYFIHSENYLAKDWKVKYL